MALGARLEFRQSQSLVMTPQLLQAIRLLQLSAPELQAYVETELERNPMLERADIDSVPAASVTAVDDARADGDWSRDDLPGDSQAVAREFGSNAEMLFPEERVVEQKPVSIEDPNRSLVWEERGGGSSGRSLDEDPDLEAYVAAGMSLHEHLERQLGQSALGALQRLIGEALIAAIDENGYLGEPLPALAARLGVAIEEAEAVLLIVQRLDPRGWGHGT